MGPLNRFGLRSEGATRRAVLFDTMVLCSVLEFLVEASCFVLFLGEVAVVSFAADVTDATVLGAAFFLVFVGVEFATGDPALAGLSAMGTEAAELFESAFFLLSGLLFGVGNLVSTCTGCRAVCAAFGGSFFSFVLATVGLTGAFLVSAPVFALVPVDLMGFSLLDAVSDLATTCFALTVVAIFLGFEAVVPTCFFFAAIASLPAGSKSGAYDIRTWSRCHRCLASIEGVFVVRIDYPVFFSHFGNREHAPGLFHDFRIGGQCSNTSS